MAVVQTERQFRMGALTFGAGAAALHFSAALKSLPGVKGLPIDITPPLFVVVFLAAARRFLDPSHRITPGSGLYFTLQIAFGLWLICTAAWSSSTNLAEKKVLEFIIFSFSMTIIATAIVQHTHSFKGFVSFSTLLGFILAIFAPIAVKMRIAVLGGSSDIERIRIQYQIVGLLLAASASAVSTHLIYHWPQNSYFFLLLFIILSIGQLSIGSKMGLIAQLVGTSSGALMAGWRKSDTRYFRRVGLFTIIHLTLFGIFYWLSEENFVRFHSLSRLSAYLLTEGDIRTALWKRAIGEVTLMGLGPAGFASVAGFGDLRKWHTHNLWLEAFVEGGVIGGFLFSGAIIVAFCNFFWYSSKIDPAQYGIPLQFWNYRSCSNIFFNGPYKPNGVVMDWFACSKWE
ncbi:MAG: O-antigen ligase family protein [Acetobacteraceae bacterium]|nr:O-antigen ligase family protein [Acetobacteraceae bacterium]